MSSRFVNVLTNCIDNARRLSLGLLAIVAVSAILLWADRDSRTSTDDSVSAERRIPHVAIVQHASIAPIDEGVRGMMDGLAERGYVEGKGTVFSKYNPQGDFATANTIAKAVVSEDVDLIITASTISLQTVAGANRLLAAPKRHLFAITTDPFGAGVGVSREQPFEHPPYIAGVGSISPIRELFELVLSINPSVRTIGLVWNPAEANSEASTLLARELVKELGMVLVEGNAENSTAAGEVAQSLLSRGIDVLWLSTDITTTTAEKVMIRAAQQAGVPVISSLPESAYSGALIAMGSSYYDIGINAGHMAADILEGRDMAAIPVINWTPIVLRINLNGLKGLRHTWTIPEDVTARARTLIDASGTHEQDVPVAEVPEILRWHR